VYIQLSIHTPVPGHVADVVDSMHRFGAALKTQAGFMSTGVFTTHDGRLVGMALWESEAAYLAGRLAGREAIAHDPLDHWEAKEILGLSGSEV
jgi:heme-degrading monooxygenase HmoA